MTEQEALKDVRFCKCEIKNDYFVAWLKHGTIPIVCKALEKQIPKEPFFEGDGYADGAMVYDTWRCPNCDKAYELEIDEYNYCTNCGQALKWE